MENWTKGKELFDNQEFEKALDYFSRHLKLDPYHIESIYHRAMVYRRLEAYDKSLLDFDVLVNLVPTDASIISERGIARFYLKDSVGAIQDLDKAQELEPENAYRYSSRAYIRAALNDLDGALEDYQKAVELNPEDAISLNNMGLLEESKGRGDVAKKYFGASDEVNERGLNAGDSISGNKNESEKKQVSKPTLKESFLDTLKKLFTDKSERKAFINFIKSGAKK